MRKVIIALICCMTVMAAQGQRVSHSYRDVSMADALRQLSDESREYTIYFLYNELEDFRVTTTVRNKTVPEAIRQMIGFYPIKMTLGDNHEIFVECTHKTDRRLIGRLVNEKGEPLEYANIIVMNPRDSAMITHGVSNASGYFVVPVELSKVIARISYVGYKTVYKSCNTMRIGTIKMEPEVIRLQETLVTAPKMQVERNGTNYTLYSLDGTIMGNAGNALDLLRWAPGIMVDGNDGISVIGRSTTDIYVNDRRIISKSELKSMSSQDIKRVEVIRDPDAQYASSADAVIKLYTHNSIKNNLGASLTEVLDFKHKVSNATTLTLDGKYNKLSGNLSFTCNRTYSRSSNTQFTQATGRGHKNDTTHYVGSGDDYHVFAGINYALTPNSVVGFQYNGNYSTTGIDLQMSRLYRHEYGNSIYTARTANDNDMRLKSVSNSFSASYLWDRSEDSRLLLIADYAASSQSNAQETRSLNTMWAPPASPVEINYYNDYSILTATGRYDFATRGWNYKTGLELGHTNNYGQVEKENDIQRYTRDNNWVSAYYTLDRQWERWRVSVGLRYEFDHTKSRQDVVIRFTKNYHDVLPSVKVVYQVSDELDLSASYRRTLVRPSYNQLRSTYYYNVLPQSSIGYSTLSGTDLYMFSNPSQEVYSSNSLSPNIIYISSDDIATGNPELRPTLTDRVTLTAQYRRFVAQLSYRRVDNAIQTIHQILSSGTLCQSPINIRLMKALTLDLDYSYSNRKLNVFLLASGTLPRIPIPSLGYDEIESRPFAVLNGNVQYSLTQHLMLGCNLLYSTPWTAGYTRYNSMLGLNLSLMAHLFNDRLTLSANVNDVFHRSMSTSSETSYVTVFNRTDVHNDTRSVSVMARWTFNTISNPFKRRSGNEATLQRTQETVN